MEERRLGEGGPLVSVIGFGAFKIGRNEKIKYESGYALPSEEESARLLNDVLDAGVTLIDTAPAYGLSEQRIGAALSGRRNEFVLSTKAGESFEGGESRYDYTAAGMEASVMRSLDRLRTEAVDVLLIHSDGDDLRILNETDAVGVMTKMKERGIAGRIGFSGKTVEGARAALDWADVLMVEYHSGDDSHAGVMGEAAGRGVGVMVKKALASGGLVSGRMDAGEALRFALSGPGVASAVVGTLQTGHLRANIAAVGG